MPIITYDQDNNLVPGDLPELTITTATLNCPDDVQWLSAPRQWEQHVTSGELLESELTIATTAWAPEDEYLWLDTSGEFPTLKRMAKVPLKKDQEPSIITLKKDINERNSIINKIYRL